MIELIQVLHFVRLVAFIDAYNISVCRELSGGFDGICLSEPDIAELWRLHYEVHTLYIHWIFYTIFIHRRPTLVICREYFQPMAAVTSTTSIFPVEYQRLMK